MRNVISWNEGWRFAKCPQKAADPAAALDGEIVTLPHTWYADGDYYQGDAVYQKSFSLTPEPDQKVFLRFAGVDKVCEIYLNGQHIGGHKGGYTRFAVELTDALRAGENLLTVLVNNETGETVSPLMGDFATFGGIYRDVELVLTGPVHFDMLYHGSEGVLLRTQLQEDGSGTVSAEAHICGGPAQVRCTLTDAEGRTVAQGEDLMTVAKPHLWNGQADPYLYTVTAELLAGGETVDSVAMTVGFRSASVDPDKGFFLNGEHLKLRGVAKHQDTAGVFCAAGQKHWEQDISLIEEMGANAVRLSHYPHPQQVYDLCDRRGLVVWAEIPMLMMNETMELLDNAKQQLTEMILQNLHHPSICFWGIQNEIGLMGEKPYMTERLHILNDHVHKLDPSRFTTSANPNSVEISSPFNEVTDVTCYNIYYGWYYGVMPDHAAFLDAFHAAHPAMPLGISEYGVDTNIAFHSETPKVNDYTEEYQALYHETIYPYMAERDFVWGSFVWNMFDFVSPIRRAANIQFRNLKGLVTHDRATRKDSFYYYKAIWSKEPFVQIAEKRFAKRASETMTVKVYTNQPSVRLEAAGHVWVEETVNGTARFASVPLEMGDNVVTALAGELTDTAVFTRVAEPETSYVYVDNSPGLHVRDWFVDADEEARMFPNNAYSLRDKVGDLMACPEAMEAINSILPKLGEKMRTGPDTFSLEKFISYLYPDCPEEEAKQLNQALNGIPK